MQVTSAYIDFFTDHDIIKSHNRPRNRRLVFILSLVTGSFIGACAFAYVGPSFPLLIATLCKACVATSFLFNRPLPEEELQEDATPTIQEAATADQLTEPA